MWFSLGRDWKKKKSLSFQKITTHVKQIWLNVSGAGYKETIHICVLGHVEEVETAEKNTLRIFKSITLIHDANMVVLEVRAIMHRWVLLQSNTQGSVRFFKVFKNA